MTTKTECWPKQIHKNGFHCREDEANQNENENCANRT